MLDTVLTRRIVGEDSPLVIEFLVVPRTEAGALTSLDASVASLREALERDSRTANLKVRRDDFGSLAELGSSLTERLGNQYGRDLQRALEEEWIPLPQSPTLRTFAAANLLANATGLSIAAGEWTIGFAGETEMALVVAIVILVADPVRSFAEDLSIVARGHLAARLDRWLGQRDGILVHDANIHLLDRAEPDVSNLSVTYNRDIVPREASRSGSLSLELQGAPRVSGRFGSAGETKGRLVLLAINNSDSGFTLLAPKIELEPPFSATTSGYLVARSTTKTIDLAARMATELIIDFSINEAYTRGQRLAGTVLVPTSHSGIDPGVLFFELNVR